MNMNEWINKAYGERRECKAWGAKHKARSTGPSIGTAIAVSMPAEQKEILVTSLRVGGSYKSRFR